MQFYWSDSEQRSQDKGCESLAPFVMALFDGEANEEQAKQARAHLLVCQSCAHRWLDWNRSRDLLRTVEVPAPPPTLFWRVLMACRVASYGRRTRSISNLDSSREEFGAVAGSGTPDALRAQILARTTRAGAYSDTAAYSDAAPSKTTKRRRSYGNLAFPSVAVPALAMFLMVSQRDQLFTTSDPDLDVSEVSSLAAPERPVIQRAAAPVALRSRHFSPKKPAALHTSALEQPIEVQAPTPTVHRVETRYDHLERSEDAPEARVTHVAFNREAASRDDSADIRDDRTVALRPEVKALALPRASLPIAPVAPPSFSNGPVRPASLSDKGRSPRLRAARWELSTPKVTRMVESTTDDVQSLRVAVPSNKPAASNPPKLLAENFDSDDSRVDEVRSVVDDFRATLSSPSSSDADLDAPAD